MKRLPIALIVLSAILLTGTTAWGQLTGRSLILQDSSLPARKVTLRTPGVLSSSYSLIYPSALPSANGYLLTGTTAGQLSWSDPAAVVGSLAWLLNGNSSITVPAADTIGAGENFLGTTGAQELVLGTNRVRRVRVSGATGNIGIGAAPSAGERLNVQGMINTDSSYNIDGARWLWAGIGGANNVLVGNTGNMTLMADDNTFIGTDAGRDAWTGIDNTFVGSNAGRTVNTGSDNTIVGSFSGQLNSEGSANTIVGSSAGNVMTVGDHNTLMGFATGNSMQGGNYNTLLGARAAASLIDGDENTLIGGQTGVRNPGQINSTALGARAYVSGNNMMVLGSIAGQNGATADVNVGIGTPSPNEKLQVHNGNIWLTNTNGTAGRIIMSEPGGGEHTAFVTQAQNANIVYTLPAAAPTANGYLLSSTTGGTWSWASPSSIVGSAAWLLTGNNITSGGTGANQQFIGTTSGNTQPFVLATNGAERARIDSNGLVGIGTNAPEHKLHVVSAATPGAAVDHIGARVFTTLAPTAVYTGQTNSFEGALTVNNASRIDANSIVVGVDGGALHSSSATAQADRLIGVRGWISSANTSQTLVEGIGVLGYITNNGRMTNATSVKAYGDGFAGSTITNWRGLHVGNYSGPVANAIGVDIDQQTFGTTSNTAFRYNHATRPVSIDGAGRMMIGTATPFGERLTVIDSISPAALADKFATRSSLIFNPAVAWNGTQAANGLHADVVMRNSQPVNGERVSGIIGTGVMDSTATAVVTQLRGVRGNIVQRNAVTAITNAIGVDGSISNDGVITDAASVMASMRNSVASTTRAYRGVYVTSPNAGTIDSLIGIDVQPMTIGGRNFAFRYDHATSPVAITGTGQLGVGTNNPGQKLEVHDGNLLLSNSGAAAELRIQEPNASGANYTAFKAQGQSADITYTLPPSLPVGNSYVLASTTGGSLTWENPATINSGNFVQYNVPTPQGTAVAANRLFDVRYGGLAAGADALGARIVSTSGTNANATGLTITGTANGTGSSTGLNVTASGGTNNYAALFMGGNVGIGIAIPNSKLYVTETIGTANRDTQMVALWYNYNPAANPAPTVSVAGQIVRMQVNPSAAQTSGLISGADIGAGLVSTATAGAAEINGIRGFAANSSTTQTLTNAVGVMGHVQNTGLTTNGISFLANSQFLPNGTMTNYYGLKVESAGMSGGTVANVYGISIDPISGGTLSNTAFRYNHATFPTIITAAGKVGHGTLTPTSYTETVGPTYTSNTTVPGSWTSSLASKISQVVTPSAATAANFHSLMAYDSLAIVGSTNMTTGVAISRLSRVQNYNTSTINEIRSMQANIHNEGTGLVGLADALYANVSNNSSGTITSSIAFNSLLENTGGGTVTTATGFRTRPNTSGTGNIATFNGFYSDLAGHTGTGRVQNYYGVVVANIDGTEVTGSRYAFYYGGTGGNKPFAVNGDGNVGIGTATPAASLDVDGAVVLREDASIANVNADNFPVTIGNRSYMRITCNQGGAAGTKTLTLSAGLRVGQILVIEALGNNTFEIADNTATNRTNTPANRSMSAGAVETMIWNGSEWLEISYQQN